jgi:hypothetical protein
MKTAAPENAAQLAAHFQNIAMALTRADAQMEQNAREGNRVAPHWPTFFLESAQRIDAGRFDFQRLLPNRPDVAANFQRDVIELGRYAGRLDVMINSGHTYAGYWGTVLDRPIADSLEAARALTQGPPAPPAPPMPPAPPHHGPRPTIPRPPHATIPVPPGPNVAPREYTGANDHSRVVAVIN